MTDTRSDDDLLDSLQREAFRYFVDEADPETGLVRDKAKADWPASIAVTGLALSAYVVGVERGFLTRDAAVAMALRVLRFFRDSPQGPEPEATGYKGFYYHFLDMKTGRRVWNCELSTIDSAYLLAGALSAGVYFDGDDARDREIRECADVLYRRADWVWAQNGTSRVSLGWKPRTGFIKYCWHGYDESLILQVLGLGSPTYPLPEESYRAWASSFRWKRIYGQEYLYAGPLFIHQLSHLWLDLRGLQDEFMRGKGSDYFENSRRATLVQQQYAIRNPKGWKDYGANCWGISASNGPEPYDYVARGVPFGPDDGTLAPCAAAASLPFAPEVVIPAIRQFSQAGFQDAFNPTRGWSSPWPFGLNQGPMVLMADNHRAGSIWRLMRGCESVVRGLRRAGFEGGWLEL